MCSHIILQNKIQNAGKIVWLKWKIHKSGYEEQQTVKINHYDWSILKISTADFLFKKLEYHWLYMIVIYYNALHSLIFLVRNFLRLSP